MKFFDKLFGSNKPKEQPTTEKKDDNQQPKTVEDLLNLLAPYKKIAYKPITERTANSFNTNSKLGGFPYLRNAEDWPVCPNCKNNMQLFLQLNLNELPVNKEDGLIQLFYCTNGEPLCEVDCEAFFPFSESVVCRKISTNTSSFEIQPRLEEVFGEKKITGWEPFDDYPNYDELSELGLNIEYDVYELLYETNAGLPASGDKLYGWPHWIQNIEYPNDRKTGTRMELLFQIDSEDNLPYMFGDVGTGHLTQNKDNADELAFGWACS